MNKWRFLLKVLGFELKHKVLIFSIFCAFPTVWQKNLLRLHRKLYLYAFLWFYQFGLKLKNKYVNMMSENVCIFVFWGIHCYKCLYIFYIFLEWGPSKFWACQIHFRAFLTAYSRRLLVPLYIKNVPYQSSQYQWSSVMCALMIIVLLNVIHGEKINSSTLSRLVWSFLKM